MKKIIALLTILLVLVTACETLNLQISQQDEFVPLPIQDGSAYVSCSSNINCQEYLLNHNIVLETECRIDVCHYRDIPVTQPLGRPDNNE